MEDALAKGVTTTDGTPGATEEPAKPAAPPKSAHPAGDERGKKLSKVPIPPEAPDFGARMEALAALGEEASACTKCGLCETRTKVVYGSGTARTGVMFIGEAPGADEDRQGLPFVGRAGKLLDQIIDAVGFDRSDVMAFLESDRGLAEVAAELDFANDNGITAVPTYVVNGQWAIPGAQEPETFAQVLRKMAGQAVTQQS